MKSTGTKAGTLTKEMSEFTGLREGTPIAVGIIDAHAAGQAAVGDLFAHFIKKHNADFQTLTEQARLLKPGESGLLALDWQNGCRMP